LLNEVYGVLREILNRKYLLLYGRLSAPSQTMQPRIPHAKIEKATPMLLHASV
jgi:hypothetical protein